MSTQHLARAILGTICMVMSQIPYYHYSHDILSYIMYIVGVTSGERTMLDFPEHGTFTPFTGLSRLY